MATTPESRIKDKIRAVLKSYEHIYFFMPVPTGMGATTVDFLCCYRGHFFGIEAKAPGKIPTPRQEYVLEQIRLAGGSTFTIDGDAGLDALREFLEIGQQVNERTHPDNPYLRR
jgi:hypothetical protein